jgi:hypothetical protein
MTKGQTHVEKKKIMKDNVPKRPNRPNRPNRPHGPKRPNAIVSVLNEYEQMYLNDPSKHFQMISDEDFQNMFKSLGINDTEMKETIKNVLNYGTKDEIDSLVNSIDSLGL